MPAEGRKFHLKNGVERPITADLLLELGWTQTDADDWQLWWGLMGSLDQMRKINGRRHNHYHRITCIGWKDGLHRTLTAAARQCAGHGRPFDFDFVPRTFLVPEEDAAFRAAAARSPAALWIEKPRVGARGEGIRLISGPQDAKRTGKTLVQQYLSRPHLLDGFKYTLRCYVLVTSLEPLVAWVFDDGFVKLASRPFSLEGAARTDRFRHLTNPDVLKHDKTTPVSSRNSTHAAYRGRLLAAGIDHELLFRRIRAICARTLAAGQGPLVEALRTKKLEQRGCFELLGFDVMVDADLRPWLVEVNITPSLAVHADSTSPSALEETALKRKLILDLFQLIDLEGPLPPEPRAAAEALRLYAGQFDRRAGFLPLVPGPEPLEALQFYGACGPFDLALAGMSRPLRPRRARAFALGDGAVLQAEDGPQPLLLDAGAASVWRCVEQGMPTGSCVERHPGDELGVLGALAAWAHEGALAEEAAADVAPRAPGPVWNDAPRYDAFGLRFTLRITRAAWRPSVEPTLAWARASDDGSIDAAFEVRSHGESIAVEDERGYQVCVAEELLAAAVHEMIARRAALRAAHVGVVKGQVVEGALVLGAPGEVSLDAVAGRIVARAARTEVRVDRIEPRAGSKVDALEALLRARRAPAPPLSAAAVEALVRWIAER